MPLAVGPRNNLQMLLDTKVPLVYCGVLFCLFVLFSAKTVFVLFPQFFLFGGGAGAGGGGFPDGDATSPCVLQAFYKACPAPWMGS